MKLSSGNALLLFVLLLGAAATEHEIHGVDFVFHEQKQEWDCTLPASQLALLGIDLRDETERFPPSPPAAADQLFRTSHKFGAHHYRDNTANKRDLFLLSRVCGDNDNVDNDDDGGEVPVNITELCDNNAATANKPCGYCQNSVQVELEIHASSSFRSCSYFTSCANRTDSICTGDAPAQCFDTACPANLQMGGILEGLCSDGNYAAEKRCPNTPRFCKNEGTFTRETYLCDEDGLRRRLLETIPGMAPSNQRSFLGFVRVPKTGSTTLLKFLHASKQMIPWAMFLQSAEEETADSSTGSSTGALTRSSGSCVFGPARSMSEIGGHGEDEQAAAPWWNACPHVAFGSLVASWTKTLPSYHRPDDEMTSVSLNAITMVRDPFDRLVSYFYYLRKFSYTNNFLMNTVTKTQYQFVEDNDLEGWLRQLHLENGGRGLNLPYQYKYVHQDVNEAIRLIQDDGVPEVYTLLTECYEVSLRLLAQNFVGFQEENVDAFLESDEYESNHNKPLYSEKPDKATLAMIRSKAEVWFADDFTFYDAAVEQFVVKMAASTLSDRQLETCRYWSSTKGKAASE